MTFTDTTPSKVTFMICKNAFEISRLRTYRSFCGGTSLKSQRRAPSRWCAMHAELVKLPTGTNMEVLHVQKNQNFRGVQPSERPPLIFVHGSFHAAWCFQLFQSFFASHGFENYAVSLRGAGNTEWEQTSKPTAEDHVSDLSALLQQLCLPVPPIIIGHSIGGFIVQKWAEQDTSASLGAIVLMSSVPPSGNSKLVGRIMRRDGFWKTMRITLGFVRRSLTTDLPLCREMFFSPKTATWFSEDIEGDNKLGQYMELFKMTSKTLDVKSLKSAVRSTGNLRGKALVIGGSADSLIDVEALEESVNFWEADLCTFEDAPHDIMLYSKWEEVAGQVLEWITKNVHSFDTAASSATKEVL